MAKRTENRNVLRFSAKSVIRARPSVHPARRAAGAIERAGDGRRALGRMERVSREPRITVSLLSFTTSGVIRVGFLLRRQSRMLKFSEPSDHTDSPLSAGFFSSLHRWYAWGTPAIVLPLISLHLMVNKPALWQHKRHGILRYQESQSALLTSYRDVRNRTSIVIAINMIKAD